LKIEVILEVFQLLEVIFLKKKRKNKIKGGIYFPNISLSLKKEEENGQISRKKFNYYYYYYSHHIWTLLLVG